jgi:hypothetical protein
VPLQKKQRISLSHSQSLAGSFIPPFEEAVRALKPSNFLGKAPVVLPQLFDSHGQQVPKRGDLSRLESEICPSVVTDKQELAFLRLQHGLLSELHDRNQHVCVLVEAINSTLHDSLPAFPQLGALFSVLGSTLTSTTALGLTSLVNSTLRTRDLHLKGCQLLEPVKEELRGLPPFREELFPGLQEVRDSSLKMSSEMRVETAVSTLSSAFTKALDKIAAASSSSSSGKQRSQDSAPKRGGARGGRAPGHRQNRGRGGSQASLRGGQAPDKKP